MGSKLGAHGELELLDLSTWTWETRSPYYTDVNGFATLYFDNSMFVFGGESTKKGKNLDTIRSYDPDANTWTDRGTLLQTHITHSVIISLGEFLVLGDSSYNHESEKCAFDGDLFKCEKLFEDTNFGSAE